MVKTRVSDKLEDAVKILEFLETNERTQYRDQSILMISHTLNEEKNLGPTHYSEMNAIVHNKPQKRQPLYNDTCMRVHEPTREGF